MDTNKAPGPDGINTIYLRSMWNVKYKDIHSMVLNFTRNGDLPEGLNSSFIVLIPKVDSPKTISDFRPKSLINCTFKILLKVLANRLSTVMGSIVSEIQSGFIKGRHIADSLVIANEIVHCIPKKKVQGLVLKLDFAKAFDMVKWSFLFHTLDRFGFPSVWIQWIRNILNYTKMSVLVNGSPTAEFKPQRLLPLGDPLSPLLFNLIAEILHLLLAKGESLGIFKGIKLGNGPTISHVQFVDDTIIFLENSEHSCKGIKLILTIFELLSGLKINYNKSHLFTSKADNSKASAWARIMGCEVGNWPLFYLGANLGCPVKKQNFWLPLVKKVKTKLSKWKSRVLNKSGRVVLIRSTLNSIPA